MSETEDQKVRMGEAVSPEDTDPRVIGNATATMMLVRECEKRMHVSADVKPNHSV
jgi:hypothetical protein